MVTPTRHAGSVRTQVSKAGFHWAAVLALLCLPGLLIAQSTGKAEHSRPLERSGQLLFEQGVLLCQREAAADKREALSLFLHAAEDFKAAGAVGKQATAMLMAGFASKSLSEDREALGYFKSALLLFQRSKHHPGEIDALIQIGVAHYHLEELDEALVQLNQALELSRKLRERRGTANTLCVIAQVHVAKKELQRAIDVYKEALPMLRALDDREAEARAVNNLQLITAELNQQKSKN
jgi:tetratricopeptide (TPR) repeat protein